MAYPPSRLVVVALALLGCGPQVALDEDAGTTGGEASAGDGATSSASLTGSGPPATTGATTGMGPTTAPPDTSADSLDEGDSLDSSSFITGWDTDSCGVEPPEGTSFHCSPVYCDTFAQDCPEGEKCMPWANDGGPAWNSTRCTPVVDDPAQAGEACIAEGSGVSGVDNCDVGLMCFWVDPETNDGTCLPLCAGSPDDPICPVDGTCTISAGGELALCLEPCDPIVDDCSSGHCFPNNSGFVCHLYEPGDTPIGGACDYPQACVAGSACIDASVAGDCEGVGCCASYCDLGAVEPDAPCLAGQTCLPWWEPGQAPDPWAHVGVCGVPQ